MKIGLIDVDGKNFPNFALMKIAKWHRSVGHNKVEFVNFLEKYDVVYSSKVFTFSREEKTIIQSPIIFKGGTGESARSGLDDEIEGGEPDYTLYPRFTAAYGFLTRGCIRNCPWCIVPEKEGGIRPYRDIETILQGRKTAVLMDNNVLASNHGIRQLEEIAQRKIRVDFNQGLDARLVTKEIAKVLARIKWIRYIRFACDTLSQVQHVNNATILLEAEGIKKHNIFVYTLVKEIPDAHERICFLRRLGVSPFAQPYRDFANNKVPTTEQRRFSRWVNHKAIFHSTEWEDYK
jgi:hypothetical protein